MPRRHRAQCRTWRIGLCIALAGLTAGATAGVVTPISDTASSFYGAMQDPANLINGNGLLGNPSDVLSQTHSNNASAAGMWHSSGGAVNTNWVSFDLGT